MPKVSVIVPVYNVEQYIERCARSLFEQTLENIGITWIILANFAIFIRQIAYFFSRAESNTNICNEII